MKRTKLAAIDVGTTKICTIIADTGEMGRLRILGVGVVPSKGIQKGTVVNINEARQYIHESILKAEQIAGCKVESAVIGVTGRHINSVTNQAAVAITRQDQVVRSADLKRVLTATQTMKIPAESKPLHIIPRTYKVDNQEGINNPVGMHGFRLDAETHIVTAGVASMQNLTKCIRGVGVEVDEMVLEPLASAEAVLNDEEKQNGVLLADIGGGTTDIAIFKDGTICHTSVLPIAGYQVTHDISVGLGLSFEMAEEMKKRYGDLTPVDDRITAKQPEQTITQDGHSISYKDLSDIIRMRIEELLRLIVMELPQSESIKFVPSGLVLTGGATNLPGLAEMAEEVTHLPVRVGIPVALDGVSDTLADPAFATGVGLLLWKLNNRSQQNWPTGGVSSNNLLTKVFSLLR
ncbi:MAG: cell division protein FtsA [Chloroflexi bacterium]|nr:cell division protein FtsA [Chloroflexota bacterium]